MGPVQQQSEHTTTYDVYEGNMNLDHTLRAHASVIANVFKHNRNLKAVFDCSPTHPKQSVCLRQAMVMKRVRMTAKGSLYGCNHGRRIASVPQPRKFQNTMSLTTQCLRHEIRF